MRLSGWPVVVLALFLVHAQASGQSVGPLPPAAMAADSGSGLVAGDVIRLRIWREPDLSGDFSVDEGGAVTLPKIGRLRVQGLNAVTLKDTLIKSYERYLRNVSIEVMLLRRVNVAGAVRNPGLYPVDATMTLSDVIAAAGGATPLGKIDEVELLRGSRTITAHLTGDTRISELHLQSGDRLLVPEKSWASRNTPVIAAIISASVSLIIALSR
jgi:polysaccharide export outer membrane protein